MDLFISNLSSGLFWDVDPETLNEKKHKRFIIQRVLSRGSKLDFDQMTSYYSHEELIKEVKNIRSLDAKSAHFAAFYFSIPKNEMLCYTKKHSRNKHYHY